MSSEAQPAASTKIGQPAVGAHEEGERQFVLALVVAVDRAFGDFSGGGDLAGGGGVDPELEEKLQGGGVDALLPADISEEAPF